MNDDNLIVFFSWGRKDLTEAGFKSLLESKREQDRLLVIDQECLNKEFYIKHKDDIDYLIFFKKNYHISPIWMFLKNFILWLKDKNLVYRCEKNEDVKLAWMPSYVNIIESDTLGKKGWIDRVLKGFDIDNVKIVSGYNGVEHSAIRKENDFLIKEIVNGVNMIIEIDYFIKLLDGLLARKTAMDWKISEKNQALGNLIAILPDEIIHTGINKSRVNI